MGLLKEAVNINENMPRYVYEKLLRRIENNNENIDNMKILMLGISYKANTGDTRRSQALVLYNIIKDKNLSVYDPIAQSNIKEISSLENFNKSIKKADIIILSCAHDQFLNIDFSKYKNIKYILDCWNKLDEQKIKNIGINYIGVGI